MANPAKKILGIDPGTNVYGFAIIQGEGEKISLLDIGVKRMPKNASSAEKLKIIFSSVQYLVQMYDPEEMAIEAPFYGKNPQSMLKLGRAQGVAIAAAMTNGVEVTEYSPRKIKQSVAGNGNASKEQVAAMVRHILNVPFQATELDATDALAAAICHWYNQSGHMSGVKRYAGWGAYLKENPKRKG